MVFPIPMSLVTTERHTSLGLKETLSSLSPASDFTKEEAKRRLGDFLAPGLLSELGNGSELQLRGSTLPLSPELSLCLQPPGFHKHRCALLLSPRALAHSGQGQLPSGPPRPRLRIADAFGPPALDVTPSLPGPTGPPSTAQPL